MERKEDTKEVKSMTSLMEELEISDEVTAVVPITYARAKKTFERRNKEIKDLLAEPEKASAELLKHSEEIKEKPENILSKEVKNQYTVTSVKPLKENDTMTIKVKDRRDLGRLIQEIKGKGMTSYNIKRLHEDGYKYLLTYKNVNKSKLVEAKDDEEADKKEPAEVKAKIEPVEDAKIATKKKKEDKEEPTLADEEQPEEELKETEPATSAADPEVEDSKTVPEPPLEGLDMAIAGMLQKLITDEWEAIDNYNSAITTITTEDDTSVVITILKDIVNEEMTHVGQLEKTLQEISPNAHSIDKGKEEAKTQIDDHKAEIEAGVAIDDDMLPAPSVEKEEEKEEDEIPVDPYDAESELEALIFPKGTPEVAEKK